MRDKEIAPNLPAAYRILEHLVPLEIPGFSEDYTKGAYTLAPEAIDCGDWYRAFLERLLQAIRDKRYLPICRLSDGEYRILFGEQPPSPRHPPWPRLKRWINFCYSKLAHTYSGFHGLTAEGVSAGTYTNSELITIRPGLNQGLCHILEKGMAAAHLSFGAVPFQEHFHAALGQWLRCSQLSLTSQNYVPFYFLYALLSSPDSSTLYSGHRVGVLHSATGAKRSAIIQSLHSLGAKEVRWHAISPDRSATERLPDGLFTQQVDLVLLGAGVGKLALFPQLSHLACPIIDVGYMFEVWAGAKVSRPFIH